MTREEQLLNGFTNMMKGFWKNQNLEVPNRKQGTKMTREEKIALLVDELEDIRCDNFDADTDEDKTLKEAVRVIKALEQKSCEDCISRQAVLDLVNADWKYENLESDIANLPPVTPQPKIGRWIIIDDCEQFIAKCSECGRIEDSRDISKYPYCHCGAKMRRRKYDT